MKPICASIVGFLVLGLFLIAHHAVAKTQKNTLLTPSNNPPAIYYVSPQGNDNWSGQLKKSNRTKNDGPLKTLHAAARMIRDLKKEQNNGLRQPIEVRVLPGQYIFEQPLHLKPEDSGTEEYPITYKSWGKGEVLLSGGREIDSWKKTTINGHKAWVADLPLEDGRPLDFQQLWVNGKRATLARSPNTGYLKIETVIDPDGIEVSNRTGSYSFTYNQVDAPLWQNVNNGIAVVFNRWMENHMPIVSVNESVRQVNCSKPSLWRLDSEDAYYLEGDRSMLDTPGEWWNDSESNLLYYIPQAGQRKIVARVPFLKHLIRLEGNQRKGQYVRHIQFSGFTISHTSWPMHPENAGYRQSSIGVGGAIYATGTQNCEISNCEVVNIGNYAIQLDVGCHNNRITRCHLHDLGAGGILIGSSNRGRSFKTPNNIKRLPPVLDHPADASSNNEVSDCRIHDGGKYYHCAIGLWIGQSPKNWIHHNEIFDFYYSGMSSGWTWGYGTGLAQHNLIEYNHFHHIGQRSDGDGPVLSDMAAIYTLGNQTGSIIRNNIIHDVKSAKYGGWGLYFDEGTQHITAKNNLIYDTMHGCFNQHYGRENLVTNNILAFSNAGVVSLGRADEHINFILSRNILVAKDGPIFFGGYGYHPGKDHAIASDYNLVWDISGKIIAGQDRQASRFYEANKPKVTWKQWQSQGNDTHSIIADPGFRNLAKRDFRFKDDTKAREIGFYPFDLSAVGPRN